MIKTNRDIKSSLDVARKGKKALSFTQMLEEKMKAELEKEFGPVLSEEKRSEIAEKGRAIKAKQCLALNKSRMKILKTKEKARIMQEARQGPVRIMPDLKKKIKSSEGKSSESRPNFKKINIEY